MRRYKYLIIKHFIEEREVKTGEKSMFGKEKTVERNVWVYFNATQGFYYDLNDSQSDIFNSLGEQGYELCNSTEYIKGTTQQVLSGGAGYSYTYLIEYIFKKETD